MTNCDLEMIFFKKDFFAVSIEKIKKTNIKREEKVVEHLQPNAYFFDIKVKKFLSIHVQKIHQ